jgi:hypothetical protein
VGGDTAHGPYPCSARERVYPGSAIEGVGGFCLYVCDNARAMTSLGSFGSVVAK